LHPPRRQASLLEAIREDAMALADEIADKLAADVIAYVERTGDEAIITKMSQALGDSSQTLQEAFVTSVRVQRAAIRAQAMLAERLAAYEAGGVTPAETQAAPEPPAEQEPPAEEPPLGPWDLESEVEQEPDGNDAQPEPEADPRSGTEQPARRKRPVPTVGGGRPRFG
jgi:hypothetical protein